MGYMGTRCQPEGGTLRPTLSPPWGTRGHGASYGTSQLVTGRASPVPSGHGSRRGHHVCHQEGTWGH